MNIYLETFGCQMNVLDSELVATQLRALGYTFTPDLSLADIVLYNTCSVRERSEQKVWSRLGALKQRKTETPSLIVGVIGCMAERDGTALMKRMPIVDLMCGPSELDQLPTLLDNVVKTGRRQHALAGNNSRRTKTLDHAHEDADGLEALDLARSFSPYEQRFQAYVRIVRGCDKFCTYCVVPYTRGPEISRAPQNILDEVRKLTDSGCLEITLLGQTVNHYIYEPDTHASTTTGPAPKRTTFADLLHLIHEGIPNLPRLRFLTNFPADFGDDILHVMRDSPRICRYLHIPAQSGCDRILKMMNRGYTRDSYLDLVTRARAIVPGIQLAGDFIVGFPTESDDDYALSRSLLEATRYKNSFIFQYSPRPGTVGMKRFADDVPAAVKRQRNNDLLRVQNRISNELNRELLGQTVEVLCDGPSGWGGKNTNDSPAPDSVVAGAVESPVAVSAESVQLGPALAAGLSKSRPQTRLDRHGQPFVAPASSARQPGDVQLTGRTTFDQIVVFNGPPALTGRILPVRVREAFGMTIFADLVSPDASDRRRA
jgi:tRNA-2-methylthio-N6-dimethylallyladenosine synthase